MVLLVLLIAVEKNLLPGTMERLRRKHRRKEKADDYAALPPADREESEALWRVTDERRPPPRRRQQAWGALLKAVQKRCLQLMGSKSALAVLCLCCFLVCATLSMAAAVTFCRELRYWKATSCLCTKATTKSAHTPHRAFMADAFAQQQQHRQ